MDLLISDQEDEDFNPCLFRTFIVKTCLKALNKKGLTCFHTNNPCSRALPDQISYIGDQTRRRSIFFKERL